MFGVCVGVSDKITECNIGIKHDFPFINIRKVSSEVLKTEGEARGFQYLPRDLANVSEWQNHGWSLLLYKSNENTAKMEKIIAHFILQPYHSLALFTYLHVLFINMLDWGRGQVLMIRRVDLKV